MRLTIIECETCAALIEVYPQAGEPGLAWNTLGDDLCKVPPVTRCAHARVEIKRLFPEVDI